MRGVLPLVVSMTLVGCAVGPDYQGPPANQMAGRAFVTADVALTQGAEPLNQWWTLLRDDTLNQLIATAVAQSPSIAVVRARLQESRAQLAQARASELPTTGLSAAYLRMRNLTSALGAQPQGTDTAGGGSQGSGGDLNLYAVGLDASWELDLFGAHRRQAEGAAAATQQARASIADALVSLSAEVAMAYVQLRDAQARLALTEHDVEIEERLLSLMQFRRARGTVTDLDVVRVEGDMQSARAQRGALRAMASQQVNRLGTLTARQPGELDASLKTPGPLPLPPDRLAVGDPAGVLRRRPDIANAERKLAQQTAEIGQNIAAYFPKVQLLGDIGFTASTPGTLFNGGNFTYVAAPVLQWTPFDFGRIRAKVQAARASRDEAEASYSKAVLGALEDAETSLAQYGYQRETVDDFAQARIAAERAFALTQIRLQGGTASTTDVLDAESKRVRAELDYEQSAAQLTQYFVALQKSLGLGWSAPDAS